MSWRLAGSLKVLRDQANELAPSRSKLSDGTIGDPAHTERTSDHNPDAAGVVRALDLTHDPDHGANMHLWAAGITNDPPPAASYVIWNARIASKAYGWVWRPYNGTNPHTRHMHVSVAGPYDDRSLWPLGDDVPLSNDDIDKVAAAVWGRQIHNYVDDKPAQAHQVLSWAHLDANSSMKLVKALKAALKDGLAKIGVAQVDVDALARAIVREFLQEEEA